MYDVDRQFTYWALGMQHYIEIKTENFAIIKLYVYVSYRSLMCLSK